MRSLAGKVAIVTGAAGGMGRCYAHRLARLGADVAVLDIDLNVAARWGEELTAPSVAEEIDAIGPRGLGIEADLSDRQAASRAIEEVADRFGRIDVLINNAGGAISPVPTSQPSIIGDDDLEKLFSVNFYSMVYCAQAAVPHLKKQGGTIVNVSTIGVDLAPANAALSGYAAAKAAVLRFTQHLAVELGPHGVRVNAVAPGIIETARVRTQAAARGLGTDAQVRAIPLRRLGTAEDCAGAVEYLATDMSAYVTGECIRVSGGYTLVAAG